MTKRIKAYKAYIDSLLTNSSSNTDWDEQIDLHLKQIGFFMHERLVHLLVMILFAIMAFITLGLFLLTEFSIPLLILFLLIMVLLIPYIQHYYLLENSVQYMYTQYDKMLELKGVNTFKL